MKTLVRRSEYLRKKENFNGYFSQLNSSIERLKEYKVDVLFCVNSMFVILMFILWCFTLYSSKNYINTSYIPKETLNLEKATEIDSNLPKFKFEEIEYSEIVNNVFTQVSVEKKQKEDSKNIKETSKKEQESSKKAQAAVKTTKSSQKVNSQADKTKTITAKKVSYYKITNFKGICQLPELPTGCEATALTALMKYKGFNVSKYDVATKYMPKGDLYYKDGTLYGPNPKITFVGDPTQDSGLGCFSMCLVKTFNNYKKVTPKAKEFNAINLSGTDLKELLQKYVANDNPVVVIVSQDLRYPVDGGGWSYPQGGGWHWMMNHHAMTIYGYDLKNDKIMVCDPLRSNGFYTYNLSKFEEIYNLKGKSAMTIIEN